MNCSFCATQLPADAVYCANCGRPAMSRRARRGAGVAESTPPLATSVSGADDEADLDLATPPNLRNDSVAASATSAVAASLIPTATEEPAHESSDGRPASDSPEAAQSHPRRTTFSTHGQDSVGATSDDYAESSSAANVVAVGSENTSPASDLSATSLEGSVVLPSSMPEMNSSSGVSEVLRQSGMHTHRAAHAMPASALTHPITANSEQALSAPDDTAYDEELPFDEDGPYDEISHPTVLSFGEPSVTDPASREASDSSGNAWHDLPAPDPQAIALTRPSDAADSPADDASELVADAHPDEQTGAQQDANEPAEQHESPEVDADSAEPAPDAEATPGVEATREPEPLVEPAPLPRSPFEPDLAKLGRPDLERIAPATGGVKPIRPLGEEPIFTTADRLRASAFAPVATERVEDKPAPDALAGDGSADQMEPVSEPDASTAEAEPRSVTCEQCGTPLSELDIFCGSCGFVKHGIGPKTRVPAPALDPFPWGTPQSRPQASTPARFGTDPDREVGVHSGDNRDDGPAASDAATDHETSASAPDESDVDTDEASPSEAPLSTSSEREEPTAGSAESEISRPEPEPQPEPEAAAESEPDSQPEPQPESGLEPDVAAGSASESENHANSDAKIDSDSASPHDLSLLAPPPMSHQRVELLVAPPTPLAQATTLPPMAADDEDIEDTRIVERSISGTRFVLQFSTGESVIVTGTGLVGRNPVAEPSEKFDMIVPITDPSKSVSKTHFEFGQMSGMFWISDRYSGNGTIVREPGGESKRCEPGKRYRVVRGTRVEIGEQFFIVS